MLVSMPNSPAAEALVEELAVVIESREQRHRPRGAGRRQELREAIAAIVGDALKAQLRRGEVVSRSRSRGAYGGHVGYTAAIATLDQLVALGLLEHHPGYRYDAQTFGGQAEWTGLSSRYAVTASLIALAAEHGITAETIKAHFSTRFPQKAEVITKPVELRRFKEAGSAPISISRGDVMHQQLCADVRIANKLLAAATWSANCQPPALRRAFRGDWTFGGRWVVAGDAPLQNMAPEDRLDILINGDPVCEVDARGSQLSIVAALAGVADLLGDPYQLGPLAAFPRDVVKAAATITLGTGRLRSRWPDATQSGVSMVELTAALVAAHPYLRDLSGLLGVPTEHSALRLQNIEANCITHGMRTLWAESIPVVPVHDSLLVPVSAVAAADAALRDGYMAVVGALIQTKRQLSDSARHRVLTDPSRPLHAPAGSHIPG